MSDSRYKPKMPNSRNGFDEKSVTARYGAAAVAKFLQTVRATDGVAETWVSEEDRIFVKLNNFQIICLSDLNIETLHAYIKNMGQTRARTQSDASGYKGKALSRRLGKRDRSNSEFTSASYLTRLYRQFSFPALTRNDKKSYKSSDSALNRKCSPPPFNYNSQAAVERVQMSNSPMKDFRSGRRHSEHYQKLTTNEETGKPFTWLVKESDESVPKFPSKGQGTSKVEHFARVENGDSNRLRYTSLRDLSRPSLIANHNDDRGKEKVFETFKEWHGANVDLGIVSARRLVNGATVSPRINYESRHSISVETPAACSANLKDYANRRNSDMGETGLSLREIKKLRDVRNKNMRKSSSPMISRIFGSMNDVAMKHDTSPRCDVKNNCTPEQNRRDSAKLTVINTPVSHDFVPSTSGCSHEKAMPSKQENDGLENVSFVLAESPIEDSENGSSENNDHHPLTDSGEKDKQSHERDLAGIFELFQKFLPQSQKHRKSKTKIQKLSRRLSMISLATSDSTQDHGRERKNWTRVINIAGTGESEALCIPGADTLGGLPDGDCKSVSPGTFAGQVKPNNNRRMSCPVIFEDDESENSAYTDISLSPSEFSNGWPVLNNRDHSPVESGVSVPTDHADWTCEAMEFNESLSDKQGQQESEMINDNSSSSSEICGVTFIVRKRSIELRNQKDMADGAVLENQAQNAKDLAECLDSSFTDSEKGQQQQVISQEQTCTKAPGPAVNPSIREMSLHHQFSTSLESTASKSERDPSKSKRCFTDSSISISSYCGDSSEYLSDISSSPETDCETSP